MRKPSATKMKESGKDGDKGGKGGKGKMTTPGASGIIGEDGMQQRQRQMGR